MRKTSYALTAVAVIFTTVLTILCLVRNDWLVVRYHSDVLASRYEAKYGLSRVCERLVVDLPGGGSGRFEDFECRRFPVRSKDHCDDENQGFCAAWTSAGYAVELAIGFGALSLISIVVGVSTHSRRRRIWRAVAGLVILHALLQLVAFAIVTDAYRTARFPTFEDARLGTAFVLGTISWVCGVLLAVAVITTGISADHGKRWAAGNRAYQPIAG
ncbi:hypothetical protein B0H10DRAFT_2002520 [Mycena sp. CBHHK59/15]|nr:hypothetical protein B0H10DRAFT_2002520 [Mycena sp. CBHHK59/15]